MSPDSMTLEQLYAERDRLTKLAKVREDRAAEFLAKSMAELDKVPLINAKLSVTEQTIKEKIEDMLMAQASKGLSERIADAIGEPR